MLPCPPAEWEIPSMSCLKSWCNLYCWDFGKLVMSKVSRSLFSWSGAKQGGHLEHRAQSEQSLTGRLNVVKRALGVKVGSSVGLHAVAAHCP